MKKHPDIYIILIVVLLLIIGTNAIYNASTFYRSRPKKTVEHVEETNADGTSQTSTIERTERDPLKYFKQYLTVLFISLAVGAIFTFFDLDILERNASRVLIAALILLVLVLIPFLGKVTNGARRWFYLFGFNIQPSELAKFALVLYMAAIFVRKGERIEKFNEGFIPPFLVITLLAFLIIMEPDLGTAFLFLVVGFSMFFYAGVPPVYLVTTGILAVPILYIVISNNTYMGQRIVGFLNPWDKEHIASTSFQLVQSLRCFQAGGLFGSSIETLAGESIKLPAATTDFILAVIAQKSGFFGATMVVLLFLAFFFRGLYIAKNVENRFRQYLAFGIVALISFQAFINIMVVVGLLPTTGLPLPFISYGRNSLLVMLAMVGVLLNISREVRT